MDLINHFAGLISGKLFVDEDKTIEMVKVLSEWLIQRAGGSHLLDVSCFESTHAFGHILGEESAVKAIDWFRLNQNSEDMKLMREKGYKAYLAGNPQPVTVANYLKEEIFTGAKGGVVPTIVREVIVRRTKVENGGCYLGLTFLGRTLTTFSQT